MENPTKSNKLRLLHQLSKTEIYVLGENIKSKVTKTESFLPIKNEQKYGIKNAMFLFSTKDAYPSMLAGGQELREMTGLKALELAEKDPKIDDIFLDLQSTRQGVWLPMKQAEFMRHDPAELQEAERSANEKDKTRRKMNARRASEPTHLINSYICNCSFPDTLEKAWADIEFTEHFNYEMVLHEPEVQWTIPNNGKVGDIAFFAHTKKAKNTILNLKEQLMLGSGEISHCRVK